MLDDTQLQDIECQASEIVRSASEIILRYFDQPLNINYKSVNSRNPVTDADNAADEFLRTEIARRFPDHAIVTEETESESDEARDITWVVDPLDGTTNFLHGLPMFAVMVAVLERGEPVVGAIYIPPSECRGTYCTPEEAGERSQTISLSPWQRPTLPGVWHRCPGTSCGCSRSAAACAAASETCARRAARATNWR